jgi:hypothetical protein
MSATTTDPSPTATSTTSGLCVTVTPGKYGYVPEYACSSNYNYNPSFTAALIFAILFGLTTFIHIYQALLYKKLRLSWVVIMGASWELASFTLRVAGTSKLCQEKNLYLSQARHISETHRG